MLERQRIIGNIVEYLEMVKYLVKNGANIEDETENGFTASRIARFRNEPEVAEYLKSF